MSNSPDNMFEVMVMNINGGIYERVLCNTYNEAINIMNYLFIGLRNMDSLGLCESLCEILINKRQKYKIGTKTIIKRTLLLKKPFH